MEVSKSPINSATKQQNSNLDVLGEASADAGIPVLQEGVDLLHHHGQQPHGGLGGGVDKDGVFFIGRLE